MVRQPQFFLRVCLHLFFFLMALYSLQFSKHTNALKHVHHTGYIAYLGSERTSIINRETGRISKANVTSSFEDPCYEFYVHFGRIKKISQDGVDLKH